MEVPIIIGASACIISCMSCLVCMEASHDVTAPCKVCYALTVPDFRNALYEDCCSLAHKCCTCLSITDEDYFENETDYIVV